VFRQACLGLARQRMVGWGKAGMAYADTLTTTSDCAERIDRIERDAEFFAAMGGNALVDADRLLVELNFMESSDVHDTLKRDRLYALRDEAVRDINRAIEDAE